MGFDAVLWGRPMHTLFHALAQLLDARGFKLTDNATRARFEALWRALVYWIPCEVCREHWTTLTRGEYLRAFSTFEIFYVWAHNRISARLNKPTRAIADYRVDLAAFAGWMPSVLHVLQVASFEFERLADDQIRNWTNDWFRLFGALLPGIDTTVWNRVLDEQGKNGPFPHGTANGWCFTRERTARTVYRLRTEAVKFPRTELPPFEAVVAEWDRTLQDHEAKKVVAAQESVVKDAAARFNVASSSHSVVGMASPPPPPSSSNAWAAQTVTDAKAAFAKALAPPPMNAFMPPPETDDQRAKRRHAEADAANALARDRHKQDVFARKHELRAQHGANPVTESTTSSKVVVAPASSTETAQQQQQAIKQIEAVYTGATLVPRAERTSMSSTAPPAPPIPASEMPKSVFVGVAPENAVAVAAAAFKNAMTNRNTPEGKRLAAAADTSTPHVIVPHRHYPVPPMPWAMSRTPTANPVPPSPITDTKHVAVMPAWAMPRPPSAPIAPLALLVPPPPPPTTTSTLPPRPHWMPLAPPPVPVDTVIAPSPPPPPPAPTAVPVIISAQSTAAVVQVKAAAADPVTSKAESSTSTMTKPVTGPKKVRPAKADSFTPAAATRSMQAPQQKLSPQYVGGSMVVPEQHAVVIPRKSVLPNTMVLPHQLPRSWQIGEKRPFEGTMVFPTRYSRKSSTVPRRTVSSTTNLHPMVRPATVKRYSSVAQRLQQHKQQKQETTAAVAHHSDSDEEKQAEDDDDDNINTTVAAAAEPPAPPPQIAPPLNMPSVSL